MHWLTPRDNLAGEKVYPVYKKRLDQIFDKNNRTVRNVAVVGDLGSGKSSLLRTYSRESQEDFIFISLVDLENCEPHREKKTDDKRPEEITVREGYTTSAESGQEKKLPFEEKTDVFREKPEEMEDREVVQKRLECSILRQILSHCTQGDLRDSALKAIPEVPKNRSLSGRAMLRLILLAGLCFGLLFEDQFGAALKAVGFTTNARVLFHALGLFILFLLLFDLAYYLWKERKLSLRLEKLTLKASTAEMEITPDSQEHCLDLYKFEMVHILERIADRHGNTVVFEDMERFASEICVETMTKLWELNQLLNNHRKTLDADAVPVRFVYMIGDTVLSAENRVKYFDVVLPVLPSLNNGNFIAVFREELLKMGVDVFYKPMQQLIELLNPYLTDHRMMLSALNEFSLLRGLFEVHAGGKAGRFQTVWLLAFAACKTLYPEYCQGIFAGTVSDELPDASGYPLIQIMWEKQWLTKTNLLQIVYPVKDIYNQWIKVLGTGTESHRSLRAGQLKNLILSNVGEAKGGALGGIGSVPEFQRILFSSPSLRFIQAMAEIRFPENREIVKHAVLAESTDAFCSCLALLAGRESGLDSDDVNVLRRMCVRHLSGGELKLTAGWKPYRIGLRSVAEKILTDPADAHLLDNIYPVPAPEETSA